jgi:hypothetical protein
MHDGHGTAANSTLEQLARENAQLRTALQTRIVIEQAKGILTERYQLSIEEAFELLRYSTRSHRLEIHALAGAVIHNRESPPEIEHGLRRQERWRRSPVATTGERLD